MGLFTPAWKSKDKVKARNAISKIQDQEKLKKIISFYLEKQEEYLLIPAVSNLTDKDMLRNVACLYTSRKCTDIMGRVVKCAWNKLSGDDDMLYVALNAENKYAEEAFDRLKQSEKEKWAEKLVLEADSFIVRENSVRFTSDDTILGKILKNDHNQWVRRKAINKVTDPQIIAWSAINDRDYEIRERALERLNDPAVIAQIALSDTDKYIRGKAIERCLDDDTLCRVLSSDKEAGNRCIAARKITNQEQLMLAAQSDSNDKVRIIAAERIADPEVRVSILLSDNSVEVRKAGIAQLEEDDDRLYDVVHNDRDARVRGEALNMILNGKGDLLRCLKGQSADNVIESILPALSDHELYTVFTGSKMEYAYSIMPAFKELTEHRKPKVEVLEAIQENTSDEELKKGISVLIEKMMFRSSLEKTERGRAILAALDCSNPERLAEIEPVDTDNIKALLYMMDKTGMEFVNLWYGEGQHALTQKGERIQKILKELYKRDKTIGEFLNSRRRIRKEPHVDHGSGSCHEDDAESVLDYYI